MCIVVYMSTEGGEKEVQEGSDDVIRWSEKVEDHTLAVLEGDIEDEEDVDFESFDGRTGVAEANTERYVTDFDEEFDFADGSIEVSVERDGGLNTVEYWSEDPDVMGEFRDYLEKRVRSVEQQPMLEPYKFEDVRSDEVAKLVAAFDQEFVMDGPLPRGSNGQPRMHLQRVTDVSDENEYREDSGEETGISAQHKIPGDAEYVIEGFEDEVAGDEEIEGSFTIRPQKREVGRYTVKFRSEDADSMAYMVNASLKAIDPDKEDFPF